MIEVAFVYVFVLFPSFALAYFKIGFVLLIKHKSK
jgi:hypothetical protein